MQGMADWDDLRMLLEAARAGSLAKASRTLGVDQSTVGRRLAQLEKRVGARLLARTRDGLSATPLGRELVAPLERMEEAALEIERRAAGEDSKLAGTVKVATTEAFGTELLVPALPAFADRFPGLTVELTLSNEVADLARREAEVSIRAVRPREASLVARKAAELAVAVYASTSYVAQHGMPQPTAQFRGHRFVGYAGKASGWPEAKWLARSAANAQVAIRLDSIPALVAAAKAGAGLALLPCFLGDRARELRRVSGILDGLEREVWVVLHRDIQKNARVRALVGFLDTLFAREGPRFRGER